MTLSELNNDFYFHDSVLEKIEYKNRELKMHCQFCEFMQANYQDQDNTKSDIIVVFHNAVYETRGNWRINGAGFLNQVLQNGTFVFHMESSQGEFGSLMIKADSVEIIKLCSYIL